MKLELASPNELNPGTLFIFRGNENSINLVVSRYEFDNHRFSKIMFVGGGKLLKIVWPNSQKFNYIVKI